jgi:hypothetical protein
MVNTELTLALASRALLHSLARNPVDDDVSIRKHVPTVMTSQLQKRIYGLPYPLISFSGSPTPLRRSLTLTFHVEGVFEAGLFVLGEEVAEIRYANVGRFVVADTLHGVRIVCGEREASWSMPLKTCCGCSEIFWDVM